MKPLQAALQGTREVGFTVLSMSSVTGGGVPAAAVDGRIAGPTVTRVCRDAFCRHWYSLLVSLTLTPMMCGWMLKASKPREQKRLRGFGRMLVALQQGYGKSLNWVLDHTRLVGVVLLGTIALNIWLYIDPENLLSGAGHWRADGRDSAIRVFRFRRCAVSCRIS